MRSIAANDPADAWSIRRPLIIAVFTVIMMLGGFAAWAVSSQLAGAVIASGRIEVERNRQVIQHPEGGVVAEFFADEGARVDVGDVLLRLAPGQIGRDRAVAHGRLFELRLRRARLEAERDGRERVEFTDDLIVEASADPEFLDLLRGQESLFFARQTTHNQEIEQLRGRISQIAAQIGAIDAQDEALEEQLAIASDDIDRKMTLLERGLIEQEPILRLRREAAQLRGSLGEVEARRAEAGERIIETELAIIQLAATRREAAITELREVRVAEEELRQQLSDLDRRLADLELRAPVSGRIMELQVFGAQSVVRPAEPIAYLVPEVSDLVITAEVPALHVDQVYIGQAVSLSFPGLDLRKIPSIQGEVAQLSADAFTDERTGQSFYRVEVILSEGEVARLAPAELLPGMLVDAFIRTRDRTPMAYLLEPISIYFERAFREG